MVPGRGESFKGIAPYRPPAAKCSVDLETPSQGPDDDALSIHVVMPGRCSVSDGKAPRQAGNRSRRSSAGHNLDPSLTLKEKAAQTESPSAVRRPFDIEALLAQRPDRTPEGSPVISPAASPIHSRSTSPTASDDHLFDNRDETSLNSGGWLRNFAEQQTDKNKPWVLCDSLQEHTYVHVSTTGARLSNEV
jgi:hypothetical protein